MNTYLSIDLDFFFSDEGDHYNIIKFLDKISHIQNKMLVDEHHLLLDHINNSGCTKIINVDYHQDIAYPIYNDDKLKLSCGTFLYFVEDRKNKEFKWYYPQTENCFQNGLGFCMDMKHKPNSKKNYIFNTQKHKCGLPNKSEISNVTHLGISCSFDYMNVLEDTEKLKLTLEKLIEIFGFSVVKDVVLSYNTGGLFDELDECVRLLF